MAFKTRRQRRYELLRRAGFLKFEARDLSRVPLKVPYMAGIIKEHKKHYKQAIKEEWTLKAWENHYKKLYKDNDWLDSKSKLSAWSMLREYEHDYRQKHPQYDSPWQKKRKQFRDFIATLEKKLAELPPLRPMSEETRLRTEAQQAEQEKHFRNMDARREAREQ